MSHKFNIEHLDRLNDPKRLELLDLAAICRRFGLQKDMTLVEIGTGTGLFAEAMLKLLPEARCYALDISPEMIEWIRKNRETGRLIPEVMEESRTPLQDETADFLFMISLHHELAEPVELLKECRRILKPGGKVLIADWTKESLDGPPVEHRTDASTVISHLEMAGFKDIAEFEGLESLFCISATNP